MTADNRLKVLAYRPAAIQVNFVGYPGTSGAASFMDYVIGDAIVSPPEHASAFSEKLVLLPHCFQINHYSLGHLIALDSFNRRVLDFGRWPLPTITETQFASGMLDLFSC